MAAMKTVVGVGWYFRTFNTRVVNMLSVTGNEGKKKAPSPSALKKGTNHREPLRATEKPTASHFSKKKKATHYRHLVIGQGLTSAIQSTKF